MPKARSGKRVGSSNVAILKEGAQGGLRKMRCPGCNGLATPVQNNAGNVIFQCGTAHCRRKFGASKF